VAKHFSRAHGGKHTNNNENLRRLCDALYHIADDYMMNLLGKRLNLTSILMALLDFFEKNKIKNFWVGENEQVFEQQI
jgi:hypothetical protein